ncbi:MAG: SUMF1/EgtB/PvdO family nonheme iron enzyme [Polyangiaceae bacterium]|nr:SUMF1/EgtB/PvdO family nonheme iron enzyme [Polyangiaceae bacterium]
MPGRVGLRRSARRATGLAALLAGVACSREAPDARGDGAAPGSAAAPAVSEPPPRALYLPEGGDRAPSGTEERADPAELTTAARRCPPDMVDVRGAFCVDRYEARLVEVASGEALSPYYPPHRAQAKRAWETWLKLAKEQGDDAARATPLPRLPGFQLARDHAPRAVSERGAVPNGHVSGTLAAVACKNAGKRLCTADEWRTACRGEGGTQFPHGERWVAGRCNVFREAHPAQVLHGDASRGHSDPRLNRVTVRGKPLLRVTGATPECASRWGDDAVHDMVGNLDEWIDDPEGTFVGGFYSRSTREGCEARVEAHPLDYHDYSLGVRCCR